MLIFAVSTPLLLNTSFKLPSLKSSSSAGNQERKQTYWKTGSVSVFLTDSGNSKYYKISIQDLGDDDTSPGINIE